MILEKSLEDLMLSLHVCQSIRWLQYLAVVSDFVPVVVELYSINEYIEKLAVIRKMFAPLLH